MVSQNVILQPQSTEAVEVNCVERGRFHSHKGASIVGRAPLVVSRAGRGAQHGESQNGVSARNRQQEVWRAVSELNNPERQSPTESLVEILQMDLRERVELSDDSESWRGYVIAVGGEPLLLEVASQDINLRAHGMLAAEAIRGTRERGSRGTIKADIQRFIEAFLQQIEEDSFADLRDGVTIDAQTDTMTVSMTSFERHYFASAINNRHPELVVA
jgi:hypothetical protein